jgi:hypothetical protein
MVIQVIARNLLGPRPQRALPIVRALRGDVNRRRNERGEPVSRLPDAFPDTSAALPFRERGTWVSNFQNEELNCLARICWSGALLVVGDAGPQDRSPRYQVNSNRTVVRPICTVSVALMMTSAVIGWPLTWTRFGLPPSMIDIDLRAESTFKMA